MIRLRKITFLVSLATIIAGTCFAYQQKQSSSLEEQPDDIGINKAIGKVNQFRTRLSLKSLDKSDVIWRLREKKVHIKGSVKMRRSYSINADGFMADVDSKSGIVTMYYNTKRIDEQLSGKMIRLNPMIASKDDAREHLLRLAKKLSGDTTLKIVKLDFCKEGQVKDQNKSGYAGAALIGTSGKVILSVDVLDGVLINYHYLARKA